MKTTRVAIVGCGDISGRHIDGYRALGEQAHIVAVCDTNRERAESAAAKAGANTRIVADFADILRDPEIEAVNLALPHHLHADLTVAAAQAGKHVLCEKPLALTPEDCDRMIAACRQAGVVLLHGEPVRMGENVTRAAEEIRNGSIGKFVGLQITFAYWQRAELNTDWRGRKHDAGGGQLIDGGIHYVDSIRHMGGDVEAVSAMTRSIREDTGDGEDLAILNLRFRGGHLGQLFACHATQGSPAAAGASVFGTEGVLALDKPEGGLVRYRPGSPPEVLSERRSWDGGYEKLCANFVDAIQNGAAVIATPEDGRENVRVVLAAYESARTGREVLL